MKNTSITRKNILGGVLLLALTACTPMMATRGNFLEDEQLKAIQIGVSTQDEVAQKLGSPTTIDPFDSKQWFYIGEKTSTKAFFSPEVQSRRIFAMQFDSNGILQSAHELDEKSGKNIEIVKKATPAPGREMNAFEQFLSNLGKFNQSGMSTSGKMPGQ